MGNSFTSLNLASTAPGRKAPGPASSEPRLQEGWQRVEVPLKKKETIEGLDDLVSQGVIASYSQSADKVVIAGPTAAGVAQAQALPRTSHSLGGGLLESAKSLFIPPNLKENCAQEYIPYRLWSLSSAVFGGALGYMSTAVLLDATRIAFSTSQKAATAAFLFGVVQRFASMGASFLAKQGDADPKKSYLISSLIASGAAVATVAVLAALPAAYVPLIALTTVAGAIGAALGNSAGVNIFNHMAKGNAKGMVGNRNGNQDLLADLAGAPIAAGIAALAHFLHLSPFTAVAAVAGPALAISTLQAARSIRMERLSPGAMDQIADGVIDDGKVPDAPHQGLLSLLRSMVTGGPAPAAGRIKLASDLEEVAPAEHASELYPLGGKDYLVNVVDGEVRLGVRAKAGLPDLLRGWIHAGLVQRALQSPLWPELQKRKGDKAGLALVDLAGRALPDTTDTVDHMGDQGWNQNPAGLTIPRLQANWTNGEAAADLKLSLAEFKKLMEKPDPKVLDELLSRP